MKLLLVADLHYALPQFDWVLEAAPRYDAVIIAGDLLETASVVEPETQAIVVLKYLERLQKLTRVLVCSGNHDLDAAGIAGEKRALWMEAARRMGVPADGDSVTLGGMLVTICPWWDGPQTQQAINTQLDAAAATRDGRPWLWLYHAPPPDSPTSWSGQRYFGDAALSGWIPRYQPDFVFCGHVHEAPFVRNGSWVDRVGATWVFNAGKQIGPVPATVSIDTEARAAAWFSLDGAEAVDLDAALVRPLSQLSAMPAWMPA